jgi:hypothetical protein
MTNYYADMIGNITVTGHLVRIDFLSQVTPPPQPQSASQDTQYQTSHHLVMPLDGFLRSLGVQEQVRAKLIEEGVVKIEQNEVIAPPTHLLQ